MSASPTSASPFFTLEADLDLGAPMAPWLRSAGADVTIQRGEVPRSLSKPESKGVVWQSAGDRFLLKPPGDVRILIEGGETVRYATGPDGAGDVRVFLLGMAWGILAMQRGLLPLHASSVSQGGDVHAFGGPSGAGKSTLAAALTQRGYGLFTDDILILDPASFVAEAGCLGHRTLSLSHDALRLAGATARGPRILGNVDKWYAAPKAVSAHRMGRLRSLRILTYCAYEPAAMVGTEALSGRQALLALNSAVFQPRLAVAVLGRPRILTWFAQVISHLRMGVFYRRNDRIKFDEDVDALAAELAA